MRREFQLPAEDMRFLDDLGLPWETTIQGAERWVLIHEHPLPDGYDHKRVTVAILISGGYQSPCALLCVATLTGSSSRGLHGRASGRPCS